MGKIAQGIKEVGKRITTHTIAINFRIDMDVLDRVEQLAEYESIDKTDWIRRAIINEIDEVEDDLQEKLIDDYLNCKIEEDVFHDLDFAFPKELREARKKNIDNLVRQSQLRQGNKK